MRRIVTVCLGGLLLLAGCPSQQEVPSAVTILAAGAYTGNVDCTSKQTGQLDVEMATPMTVEVTTGGQLYVSGLPYYTGAVQDTSDESHGITGSLTVNAVAEDAATRTVTVAGAGSLSNGTVTYNTSHNITLVQSSDTQLQVNDVYAGQTTDAGKSFNLTCGGTLSR